MSVLDRICELLNAQGKKQKDLTDYLGISKNSFTDWKSGRVKSYTKHIPEIAEFLGVSADYLLGIEKETIPLTNSDEALMFALWGGDSDIVDEEMLEDVKDFAKLLAEKKKRKLERNK